ncbi:unnamed protein product [Tenebrio molitor]|nr:unnamed protein product [Tenebrio molitor]
MSNVTSDSWVKLRHTLKFCFLVKVGVEESIVNVHSSVCRLKTQITQKVRLELNS